MILSLDLMFLGTVTIIYIIFMTFMGLKTMMKYREINDRTYIYAGWGFIGLGLPFLGMAINFISIVFFNFFPPIELSLLIQGINSPVSLSIFLLLILRLINIKHNTQTLIKILYMSFWMFMMILFLIILTIDSSLLAIYLNEIEAEYAPFFQLYLLISVIFTGALYIILGRHFWKSNDLKVRVKGKLIFYSVLIFMISTLLGVFFPIGLLRIIAMILLMLFAIVFYAGFMLPKWAENLFLKEKQAKISN